MNFWEKNFLSNDLILSSRLKKLNIEIITNKEDELELKLAGEGHTLMNILRKELFNDPSVTHAGYMIKHPLIKEVRFYIKTKKETTPIEALKGALKRLEGTIDEFESIFEVALSES